MPSEQLLLPCPFCGSMKLENWASRPRDADHDIWCVFCHNCSCEGPETLDGETAVTAWNLRATPPAPAVATGVRAETIEAIRLRRQDGYEQVANAQGYAGAMLQMLADINYLFTFVPPVAVSPPSVGGDELSVTPEGAVNAE